jgi:Contractile injection system tape measure protein
MLNAHVVQSLELSVSFLREDDAFDTQSRISDFFHHSAKAVISSVFDEFSNAGEVIALDRLEIDLGTVNADDIENQWQDRLPDRLRRVLRDALEHNRSSDDSLSDTCSKSPKQSQLEALVFFLVNGHVSWRASRYGTAHDLAQKVVSEDTSAIVNWLRNTDDSEDALARLLSQLNDNDLKRILSVLTPAYANDLAMFISVYLTSGAARAQTGERRIAMRHRIWKTLLHCLLRSSSSSSVLDQALEAMLQTIESFDMLDDPVLMAHLSSAGHEQRLLPRRQLALASKKAAGSPVSLALQLARLRKQLQLALTRGERASVAEVWQMFLRSAPIQLREYLLQKGQSAQMRQHIVHLFSEVMLLDVVKLFMPTEVGFIELAIEQSACHNAHSVASREDGNNSGHDSAIESYEADLTPPLGLKVFLWEFTLAHLLVDRGSTFNRRAYMSAMLQMMALREGVEYAFLLQTMADALRINPAAAGLVRELLHVLEALQDMQGRSKELIASLIQNEHFQDAPFTTQENRNTAQNAIMVTRQQFSTALLAGEMHIFSLAWQKLHELDSTWARAELHKQGHSPLIRHQLASLLPEIVLGELAELLVPQEGEFIVATVTSMTTLIRENLTVGRDVSNTRLELWEFTLTYLLIDRGTTFNKRSYMHSVLQQMAARESMDYDDILHALRSSLKAISHPGRIQRQMLLLIEELSSSREELTAFNANAGATDIAGVTTDNALYARLMLWLRDDSNKNWEQRFSDSLKYEPLQLKAALLRLGESPWMPQHLIDKLPMNLRGDLLRVLLPQEGEFIVRAVADASIGLKRLDYGASSQHTPMHLWEFTLTFVLAGQSSNFNRRSYAAYLLQKLASRSGIRYQDLLRDITVVLHEFAASQGTKSDLLDILLALNIAERAIVMPDVGNDSLRQHPSVYEPLKQLSVLLAPATTWSAIQADHLRQLIVAWPLESLSAISRHLEPLLRERTTAVRLVSALSVAQLSALLYCLRSADHYVLQRCAFYIAAACRADFGMAADRRLQQLQWQFIFRYLFEEGRRFSVADFARRFAMFLASQLPPSTASDWPDKLLQKVASLSEGDRELIAEIAQVTMVSTTAIEASNLPIARAKPETSASDAQQQSQDIAEPIYIANAGLVILSPYLPRLFDMLGLMSEGAFVNETALKKAILVSQFAVNGVDDIAEEETMLNKILCGAERLPLITNEIILGEHEKSIVDELLQSVIGHWAALGNTSIEGLRQSFLQREGRLLRREDDAGWDLLIEARPFDMLLDRLPWGFATVKYSWMQGMLHVEWR